MEGWRVRLEFQGKAVLSGSVFGSLFQVFVGPDVCFLFNGTDREVGVLIDRRLLDYCACAREVTFKHIVHGLVGNDKGELVAYGFQDIPDVFPERGLIHFEIHALACHVRKLFLDSFKLLLFLGKALCALEELAFQFTKLPLSREKSLDPLRRAAVML